MNKFLAVAASLMLLSSLAGSTEAVEVPAQYKHMYDTSVKIEADRSRGSGVVISDYQVLTANHVIKDDTDGKVKIVFPDGMERIGIVMLQDEELDYAVIGLSVPPDRAIADLACREPVYGESIFTIGNPFGLHSTLTRGHIIGTHLVADDLEGEPPFLPVDMPVWPGNSGGPVFDGNGDVIGIVNAGLTIMGVPIGLNMISPTVAFCAAINSDA